MQVESCIEKIEKRNHRNIQRTLFVNVNNSKDMKTVKEHFEFGYSFINIANNDKDEMPMLDEVLEVIESAKEVVFIEGISAYLRFGGQKQLKLVINQLLREIFKKLTTQTELDADKIQFVNDDFSLRTTYLTGGQLAVDVYSYVIGIIKALQECQMENNENPIIIDAPFAFTGNIQSEHIFKTLPTVSKQTILLTLDLNKIKKLLGETELYDFYIIKNDSQEQATIVRGAINSERDFRKTQQKISNNIENSLQMIA